MRRILLSCALLSATFAFGQESMDSLIRARASAQAAGRVFDGSKASGQPTPVPVGLPRSVPTTAPSDPRPGPLPPRAGEGEGHFSDGYVGLYPESDFELTTGAQCSGCNAPKQGLWYFPDDIIAVPKVGKPSLVWIGSPAMIEGARLSKDGKSLALSDGSSVPLALTPKISSNRSYYDISSTSFFQDRPLRLRGEFVEENGVRRFIARAIWPEDFRVDFGSLRSEPAKDAADIPSRIQADGGGARSAFSATALWEKDPAAGRAWAGKPVLGVMLNGSQGDDDETHGGHFSFFTGRFGPRGEMADWMFSNFYDLAQYSEKGILPSLVPMDKYMADLNSGQSWYRPTDVLVAVLKDERVALELQEKFKDLYAKYYAREVVYNHTTKSCAALVIDELRGDGWDIPKTGASSFLSRKVLTTLVRIGGGKQAADEMDAAMQQEKSRLFPRAAFEAAGADLLRLGGEKPERGLTPIEKELAADLEAVLFVRIPQLPSSRAFGSYPVASTEEYFHSVPMDHSKWKTIPSVPRSYPPPSDHPAVAP